MRVQWTIIAALLFALLTGIFAVINMDSVKVNFLFSETQSPLILVILVSTVLGGLTVGLFGIVRQYKLQRIIKQLKGQLAAHGISEEPSSTTGEEAFGGYADDETSFTNKAKE